MKKLTDTCTVRVRFSEADALGIVWHGNYVKYLEDGRESFGRRFGLSYFDVYHHNLLTPIVRLEIDYKEQVQYGEDILVETSYVPSEAAKIILDYRITRKRDASLVLTARTIQVFLNREGILELSNPPFYEKWKRDLGVNHKKR